MLVYEKRANNERHLYGTLVSVPADNDSQLTYFDEYGVAITPTLADTYLNDGHGGIIQKSTGKAVNVFIGNKNIIPGGVPTLSSIAWTKNPTKTSYSVGAKLDLTGAEITATYSDNTTKVVTDVCTFSPANGATLASTDTTVTATLGNKTSNKSITVS